jgi:tetratricopeptide (TPR) repeat protein
VAGIALQGGRLWQDFSASGPVGGGAGRIASANSNFRLTWWEQAARGFADRPLLGSGAGSFQYTNLKLRSSSFDVTSEPHDLPLQFLSETGIVGFLLAAGAAVAGLLAIRRRLREGGAAAALGLVVVAYLLHGLIDFDWDFVAVTGPALFAGGALLARPGPVGRSALGAVAAVAGAVAVFVSLLLPWLAEQKTLDALGRSPAEVIRLTRDARALDPLAVEPLFQEAEAQFARGSERGAWELYLRAAQLQPDNKETWFRLGKFELEELGCPQAALPHLERFTELDPQGLGGEVYKRALAAVDSGTATC